MVVWKRCSKCKELKELNDLNFQPRADKSCHWQAACRDCLIEIRKAAYAAKVGTVRVVKPKLIGNSVERHEDASRRYDEEMLRPLIRRYEAVRSIPGHDRGVAENMLGVALSRHRSPIACDGWIYRWVREEQSISRMRRAGHYRPKPVLANESLACVGDGPALPGNDR